MNEDKYFSYEWRYRKPDFKFCPRCASPLSLEDIHIRDQPQLVCDNCRFIFYIDPKLVATALVLCDGRALLLRRAEEPGKGLWGLPGGYVERGDDVQVAILREVREEAGLPVTVHEVIRTHSIPEEGIIQLVFLATTSSHITRVNIESTAAVFFGPERIPWDQLAFPSTRQILREWVQGDYEAQIAAAESSLRTV